MIILNGVRCETIEQLEQEMDGLSESQKECLRNDFNGIPNIPATEVVPRIVSPRQIRMALALSGISVSLIENAIASLPEPNKTLTQITWEYTIEFNRNHPMLVSMAPLLGLTEEQLDNLFILAGSL